MFIVADVQDGIQNSNIQMTYAEKLKDPRWQKKRLEILERDNFTCQDCWSDEKTLHVHHLWYESKKDPWDYENEAYLTLCAECHRNRQSLEIELARAMGHLDSYGLSLIIRLMKLVRNPCDILFLQISRELCEDTGKAALKLVRKRGYIAEREFPLITSEAWRTST